MEAATKKKAAVVAPETASHQSQAPCAAAAESGDAQPTANVLTGTGQTIAVPELASLLPAELHAGSESPVAASKEAGSPFDRYKRSSAMAAEAGDSAAEAPAAEDTAGKCEADLAESSSDEEDAGSSGGWDSGSAHAADREAGGDSPNETEATVSAGVVKLAGAAAKEDPSTAAAAAEETGAFGSPAKSAATETGSDRSPGSEERAAQLNAGLLRTGPGMDLDGLMRLCLPGAAEAPSEAGTAAVQASIKVRPVVSPKDSMHIYAEVAQDGGQVDTTVALRKLASLR
jgi:hypothetical protein